MHLTIKQSFYFLHLLPIFAALLLATVLSEYFFIKKSEAKIIWTLKAGKRWFVISNFFKTNNKKQNWNFCFRSDAEKWKLWFVKTKFTMWNNLNQHNATKQNKARIPKILKCFLSILFFKFWIPFSKVSEQQIATDEIEILLL